MSGSRKPLRGAKVALDVDGEPGWYQVAISASAALLNIWALPFELSLVGRLG